MPEIFDAATDLQDEPLVEQVDTPTEAPESPPEFATTVEPVRRHVDDYSQVMRDHSPAKSAFASFSAKPQNIFFDSQHSEEKVLLLLRRHPITQVAWVVMAIALAFVPLLLSSIGFLDFLPLRFQLAAGIGWYVLLFGFVLQSFLDWFFNVYIVTDERVIDVDFYNLIYKNVSAAKIDTIEDITAESSGVFASIFDYGTVKVQTSATVAEFEFEDVPHPSRVTAFLNEMLVEEERERLENRVN